MKYVAALICAALLAATWFMMGGLHPLSPTCPHDATAPIGCPR